MVEGQRATNLVVWWKDVRLPSLSVGMGVKTTLFNVIFPTKTKHLIAIKNTSVPIKYGISC